MVCRHFMCDDAKVSAEAGTYDCRTTWEDCGSPPTTDNDADTAGCVSTSATERPMPPPDHVDGGHPGRLQQRRTHHQAPRRRNIMPDIIAAAHRASGLAEPTETKSADSSDAEEAEGMTLAASRGEMEGVCLNQLLPGILNWCEEVVTRCDNEGSIKLIYKPAGTGRRNKNIDVAHHFGRDRAAHGDGKQEHVPTAVVKADQLNKALSCSELDPCKLGMGTADKNPSGGLRGSVGRAGECTPPAGLAKEDDPPTPGGFMPPM